MEKISNEAYGVALARKVAEVIKTYGGIYNVHRDYCGMGLAYHNDTFYYGECWEGFPPNDHAFRDEEAFVAWLSVQSDLSLSAHDHPDHFIRLNQRITKKRLEEAIARYEKEKK